MKNSTLLFLLASSMIGINSFANSNDQELLSTISKKIIADAINTGDFDSRDFNALVMAVPAGLLKQLLTAEINTLEEKKQTISEEEQRAFTLDMVKKSTTYHLSLCDEAIKAGKPHMSIASYATLVNEEQIKAELLNKAEALNNELRTELGLN